MTRKYLILVLMLLFLCTNVVTVLADGVGNDQMGNYPVAVDYREHKISENINHQRPTAGFALRIGSYQSNEVLSGNWDMEKTIYSTQDSPKVLAPIGSKILIDDRSSTGSGSKITQYDIQYRFVPKGENREEHEIKHAFVNNFAGVKNIIEKLPLDQEGTYEIFLCVADNAPVLPGATNWSANGNLRVLDTTNPNFPNGMYWYYTEALVEVGGEWWIDVITTEPQEIPEDWEIDTHLGTGKVVTDKGMANLEDVAHDLTYYQNGDKVNIDFTFWNPVNDTSIAPPLKYTVMYWKHPDSLFDMPSNYEKNYIFTDYTTQDIFPRDNTGRVSYEYTVDTNKYPFELTTGKQINELAKDYPPELKANVAPCKDDDLFLTLAVVADPDEVLNPLSETLEPGQETWISLNTNIMVVRVPVVNQGIDLALLMNGDANLTLKAGESYTFDLSMMVVRKDFIDMPVDAELTYNITNVNLNKTDTIE